MHLSLYSAGLAFGDLGPIGLGGGLHSPSNEEIALLCASRKIRESLICE